MSISTIGRKLHRLADWLCKAVLQGVEDPSLGRDDMVFVVVGKPKNVTSTIGENFIALHSELCKA